MITVGMNYHVIPGKQTGLRTEVRRGDRCLAGGRGA